MLLTQCMMLTVLTITIIWELQYPALSPRLSKQLPRWNLNEICTGETIVSQLSGGSYIKAQFTQAQFLHQTVDWILLEFKRQQRLMEFLHVVFCFTNAQLKFKETDFTSLCSDSSASIKHYSTRTIRHVQRCKPHPQRFLYFFKVLALQSGTFLPLVHKCCSGRFPELFLPSRVNPGENTAGKRARSHSDVDSCSNCTDVLHCLGCFSVYFQQSWNMIFKHTPAWTDQHPSM